MREVLLTSHSPFIISDCHKENVLVFTKDPETQKVTWERPDFETIGASANAITIKIFGQQETIGDYAMKAIEKLRQSLEDGKKADERTVRWVIPWRRFSLSIKRLTGRSKDKAMLFNYRYVTHDIEKIQTWVLPAEHRSFFNEQEAAFLFCNALYL